MSRGRGFPIVELLVVVSIIALLIGILLTFFNNWTGWSVIGGYIPRLFEAAGFGRESAIRDYILCRHDVLGTTCWQAGSSPHED